MTARYGNGGTRGRKLTDLEDAPLSDAPIAKMAPRRAEEAIRGTVLQRGAKGYHGGIPRNKDTDSVTDYANRRHGYTEAEHRTQAKLGKITLGMGGATFAATAGVTPLARHEQKKATARNRAKIAALSKASWDPSTPFHADDPAMRHAPKRGKAYDVTTMPRRAGLFRTAGRLGVAELAPTAGAVAGLGMLVAGTHGPGKEMKASERDLRAAQRRKRQAAKQTVGKARHYDPEHRRQRRLGAAEAALAIGGVASMARGVHGTRKTTRALSSARKLRPGLVRAVAASPQDLAYLGGGTAGVAGAGLVRQHAEGARGRAWN